MCFSGCDGKNTFHDKISYFCNGKVLLKCVIKLVFSQRFFGSPKLQVESMLQAVSLLGLTYFQALPWMSYLVT